MTTAELLTPEIVGIELEDDESEIASLQHGEICTLLTMNVGQFVYQHKLGRLFDGQTTFKVSGMPPTRRPDLALVITARLPADLRITADFAPDLAMEVVSETDTDYELDLKVGQYLHNNVQVIWVVRPVSQTIEIFRLETGFKSHRLSIDEELTEEKLLPGFKMPIRAIFD